MKKYCVLCGKKIKALSHMLMLQDGFMCWSCFKKLARYDEKHSRFDNELYYGYRSARDIQRIASESIVFNSSSFPELPENNDDEFQPTEVFGRYFAYDQDRRLVRILTARKQYRIFSYDDIEDYRLFEKRETVVRNLYKRALLGKIAYGNKGMLLGAMAADVDEVCSMLEIVIRVKGRSEPITLKLNIGNEKVNESWYRAKRRLADDIIRALNKTRYN